MKIIHFSDLHGSHAEAAASVLAQQQPDWVVLTGDMVPDFYEVGNPGMRLHCQMTWWERHKGHFQVSWAPTTFSPGNHEIEGFDTPDMKRVPEALVGKVGFLLGNPAEFGTWGFAREYEFKELQHEVESLRNPKVVLSHCPPYGWLDQTYAGGSIGHRPFRTMIEDSLEPPILVMCGHVHNAFGESRKGGTLIVNSATGFSVIDLDLRRGSALVVEQAQFDSIHSGGVI